MHQPTYLTQDEAAAVCNKSYDTIRRRRRNGYLPNSRTRSDGTVEVAVADLVAAGLLDPLAATDDVTEIATRSRVERDLITARQELAVQRAQIDGLTAANEILRAENAFLRTLLTKGTMA